MNKKVYNKTFKIVKKIIDKVDPMHIAFVHKNEYGPEIRELTKILLSKNLDKEKIFKATKKVFDFYFYKEDRNRKKYKKIANKIYKDKKFQKIIK